MKDLLVFGNGNISKILSHYLEKNFNIIAYVAFKKYVSSKKFNNKPLFAAETIDKKFSPKKYKFITTIGYLEMNGVRKKIYKFLKSKNYKFINYIDKNANVPNDIKIGENNILLDHVSINPKTFLGNGNIFWSNSVISHNVKMKDFNWVSSGSIISGETTVGSCNFFGSNSVVSNNSLIGNNTFFGAGTLISGKIGNNNTFINSKSKRLKIKSTDFLKYIKNDR